MHFMAFTRSLPLLVALAGAALAQHGNAEIDNQWVRVVRAKQAPHETLTLSPYYLVCLTDARERITTKDGASREVSWKPGDVIRLAATGQAEESLSDQPFEGVLIYLKPGAPKSPPIALDPVKLDPEHHIVVLEDDHVRAIRTILEPHLKSPEHEHPHYVVVYITELHTTMRLADGRTIDNPRRPGEIAWRDALKHVTENIGDHTAVEIQVELK